jgi:hypothetical protein
METNGDDHYQWEIKTAEPGFEDRAVVHLKQKDGLPK